MKFKTSNKLDELVSLFSNLREKSIKAGEKVENIRWEFLREVYSVPRTKASSRFNFSWNKVLWFIILPTVAVFLGVTYIDTDSTTQCLVDTEIVYWNEIARKPSECSLMCEGVNEVPRITNLSKEDFITKYAYTGHPVVITDAAQNWSAVGKFSFQFFKRLYANNMDAADHDSQEEGCLFFPYKSGFHSLAHALKMPKKRAEWKGKPWYIGWSNCDPVVREKLRKYYAKPAFIPDDAETGDQDWIFMGGPGPGAPIHLDMVQRPSWQAQISGQKVWTLIPPPECEHVCRSMKVTMTKGDIIVLDTNQWYHSTQVIPTGELSITIGAEYD